MRNWFIRFYNWFHKYRMRKQRLVINSLRDVDIVTLDTLDKILPILKEQLTLINEADLRRVNHSDIYQIKVPVNFLQYDFFKQWLKNSLTKISVHRNNENHGYIDLNTSVTGWIRQPQDVRITVWIPWQLIDESGLQLDSFYNMVKDDIVTITKTISNVKDPYFKKYYEQRLASALQDILLIVYTINEMVAFYEWRR